MPHRFKPPKSPQEAAGRYRRLLARLHKLRCDGIGSSDWVDAVWRQINLLRPYLAASEVIRQSRRFDRLWGQHIAQLAGGEQPRPPDEPVCRGALQPTDALPGSERKIQELTRRAEMGLDLFVPGDAHDKPHIGLRTVFNRNGSRKARRGVGADEAPERGSGRCPQPQPASTTESPPPICSLRHT